MWVYCIMSTEFVIIDDNIIIKNEQKGFSILYIKDVGNIKESPLKKFIDKEVIVLSPVDNSIYIDNNNKILSRLTREQKEQKETLTEYLPYQFYRLLEDNRFRKNKKHNENEVDCLKFAEFLSNINQHPDLIQGKEDIEDMIVNQIRNDAECLFKSNVSNHEFGDTYLQNKTIVECVMATENPSLNENADPSQGDAYTIINLNAKDNSKKEVTPYHVAFVIYSNEQYNVTMEVFADSLRDYRPKFNFYTKQTNPINNKPFHTVFTEDIPSKPLPNSTVCIVAKTKNKNVVPPPPTVFGILGKRKSSQPPPALTRSSKRSQIQTPTRSLRLRRNGGGIKRKSYTKTKKTKQTKQPIR